MMVSWSMAGGMDGLLLLGYFVDDGEVLVVDDASGPFSAKRSA